MQLLITIKLSFETSKMQLLPWKLHSFFVHEFLVKKKQKDKRTMFILRWSGFSNIWKFEIKLHLFAGLATVIGIKYESSQKDNEKPTMKVKSCLWWVQGPGWTSCSALRLLWCYVHGLSGERGCAQPSVLLYMDSAAFPSITLQAQPSESHSTPSLVWMFIMWVFEECYLCIWTDKMFYFIDLSKSSKSERYLRDLISIIRKVGALFRWFSTFACEIIVWLLIIVAIVYFVTLVLSKTSLKPLNQNQTWARKLVFIIFFEMPR